MKNFSAEPIRFVRMTERTSHLAGLWIGAAISKTSHSYKAGSTTIKLARLTGKDQGRRQCCHNKHKKFPYRPTLDVSLLSGRASYILASSATYSCIITNFTPRRRACNQVPKHAARCEFSDVMGRVMALYQECVLFDE